jgi:hypothetical protein
MVSKALATLGGLDLNVDPNEFRWNFVMKTSETRTLAGKVIQILGTTLSDITIRGSFGRFGEEGWERQLVFRNQVHNWASAAESGTSKPLRFTYQPRGWDFRVFVKAINPVIMTNEEINPRLEMILFPVDDGATKIISGIKDLYIERLSEGVGWKQTDYNGPTQKEVDDKLAPTGGSAVDYIRNKFSSEFVANSPGGVQ